MLDKKKRKSKLAIDKFRQISDQNRQSNEMGRACNKDTLHALIKACILRQQLFYAIQEQEQIMKNFLILFKSSTSKVLKILMTSMDQINIKIKKYFSPHGEIFTT